MKALSDISKIGILMIGVALLVIAGIAVHFYITFLQRVPPPSPPPPFHAYCRYNAVIIHANQDLENLEVLDNRSMRLCSFDRIRAGSEELCAVGGSGLYVVQAGEYKKIVECVEEKIIKFD